MIEILILLVHVAVAVGVCLLVLLQHGKGADVGAAFGSGSSGSLFGATGSANFLSRTTAVLAAMFFVTSLGLTCRRALPLDRAEDAVDQRHGHAQGGATRRTCGAHWGCGCASAGHGTGRLEGAGHSKIAGSAGH